MHADEGTASIFSLDLPMDQILPGTQPATISLNSMAR